MLTRRTFLSTAAALGLGALGLPSVLRAQEADPKAFIEGLAQQAINTVTAQMSEDERIHRFRTLFVSAFDLPEISRFVLGRYWRAATPEQQQQFLSLFEQLTVLTWAKRFKDYKGEQVEVTGVAKDGEKGVFVESRINHTTGGQPIPVTWRLRQPTGSYKIIDIVIEGVSMAITNRSEYNSVMQAQGGSMDGLLQTMRNKIAAMRNEAGVKNG